MGYKKMKRPVDLRAKTATDLKFDVAISTGTLTVPTLSATGSVSSPTVTSTGVHTLSSINRANGITTSTAASTAVSTRGVYAVSATSTGNGDQHLYTLALPSSGDELIIVVHSAAASSFNFKFNSTGAPFGSLALTTDLTQAALTGVAGSLLHLVAPTTARWYVLSQSGVTLSSATG